MPLLDELALLQPMSRQRQQTLNILWAAVVPLPLYEPCDARDGEDEEDDAL